MGRRHGMGRPCRPAVGVCRRVTGHGYDEAMEREAVEEGFRRTPTWRAKCQISGSGRPLRFELWGARKDLSSTNLRPNASL